MDNSNLSPADKAAIERRINIMEIEDASMQFILICVLLVVQPMKQFRNVSAIVLNQIVLNLQTIMRPIV